MLLLLFQPLWVCLEAYAYENRETKSATVPTNDTLGKGGPLQRGQAKVADLHRARGPRDEDVVALQVPVDDGRRSGVQEVETFEDLAAPRAQHLDLHHLEALQVAARQKKKKKR